MQAATTGAGQLATPIATIAVASPNPIGVAFWLKVSAAPAAQGLLLDFRDNGVNSCGSIHVNTSGQLALYNQDGVTLVTTGGTNVADGNWHWIEVYLISGNSATQKCYADGTIQWNGTLSIDSFNRTCDHLTFTSITNVTVTVDDPMIFTADSAVSPQPSDIPLGPQAIYTKAPSSDTATVQFSTSSGSAHFSLVNEVAPDGDSTYVQDNTSGHTDLYNYSALGFSPAKVWSVNLKSLVKNPGSGSISFKNTCTSAGTSSDGASTVSPSSYQLKNTIYDQDPHTSATWTGANLDSATFGIKVA